MKLSRPAAVFAAVVLLAGGVAVAVNAATATNPVKLCANNSNRAVVGPNNDGTCPSGTSAFYVARAADVQALATRLDAAASEQAALWRVALNPSLGQETGEPTPSGYWSVLGWGSDLKPGTDVIAHVVGGSSWVLGQVNAEGEFDYETSPMPCANEFYATATGAEPGNAPNGVVGRTIGNCHPS